MVAFARAVALVFVAAGAAESAPQAPQRRISDIEALVAADPLLAGINQDEALVEELSAGVLAPWETAWRRGDAAGFEALAEGEARNFAWDSGERRLVRERGGVREHQWDCGKRGAAGEARAYLARFRAIEHFGLEPVRVEPGAPAVLLVRYDLRGITQGGARRHDRGELRLRFSFRGKGGWRLTGIAPAGLESLEAEQAAFEDAGAAWGLDRVAVSERKEAIRRGGYAIAVGDYDADGRDDLLVGGYGPVQLFRNTGSAFSDATESAGLKGESLVKSAAFADMDNDGKRDLVMLRFVQEDWDADGDFLAYRNEGGGRFARRAGALTRSRKYDRTMPLTMADFDLNGTLDLYLGFPGTRDFTTLGRGPQPLASQGIWLNGGNWDFREMGQEPSFFHPDNNYPHSAIAADLDRDGRPDLVVLNDRAGLSPIYRNRPDGRLEEISAKSGVVNESWAMTAAAADYDGDGATDLVITNIDFAAARRILASRKGRESGPEEKAALERLAGHLPGNRLFRNRGDGTFEEATDKSGIRWAGEAAAGVEWVDYDNDGWPDLYVMNGLWSGGARDISSLFVRLQVNRLSPVVDGLVLNALNSPLTALDAALEGANPLLEMLRADASLSMAGGQRNRLFRNNRDGTFTELGFLAGADRAEDGYVAAVADLDHDGHQDLVLRNGDPAPGRPARAVVFLRNRGLGGRSLSVAVEGRESNREGLGAVVTAWLGDRKLTREVRGVAGAAQSPAVAYFGLGESARADRLEVRWPSGRTESYSGVPAGRVLLREGNGYVSLAAAERP